MGFRGRLFIEPKRNEEEETLNQAVNGHSLRATQRMPSVTHPPAASVHEPSDNNDDCVWRRETARLLR